MQISERSTSTVRHRYFLTVFALLTFFVLPMTVQTSRDVVADASTVNELARIRLTPVSLNRSTRG